jgi:hypothetical protein
LFGAYDTWDRANTPGNNRDDAYDAFCQAFASAVGANSAAAVQHQIRFAMPETESGSSWGRHAQTAILNKAAALEEGFIRDKHLPDLRAVGRS